MGNDLSGSDFLYIALGGIAVYGAYQFFKKDGVAENVIKDVTPSSAIFSGTPQSSPVQQIIDTTPGVQLYKGMTGSLQSMFSDFSKLFSVGQRDIVKPSFVDNYVPGAPNFSTPTGAVFVDTTGKLPNYSSITGQSVYIAPPKTTSALYSSQLSVSKAASSVSSSSSVKPKTLGAPVGTIFKSGASVKSVGKSGKY